VNKQNITSYVLKDDTLVLRPSTSLDNNNAHLMEKAISSAQAGGYKFIIIDMTDLEFLSSAGVGSILGSVVKSHEMQGDIILCNVKDNILRVLEVLDLADLLTIRPTEKEALALCGTESQ
jgi:anti-anti-sigma factor